MDLLLRIFGPIPIFITFTLVLIIPPHWFIVTSLFFNVTWMLITEHKIAHN